MTVGRESNVCRLLLLHAHACVVLGADACCVCLPAASGIASQCNPPAVSGEAFFLPLSQSSWLQVIKQAGHNAYRDNGLASLAGVLGVCGRGTLPPEVRVVLCRLL